MKINLKGKCSRSSRSAPFIGAFLLPTLLFSVVSKADMIVDGEDVGPNDYTAVFGMAVNGDSDSQWLCTGFLVAPRLLLTAAHCLKSAKEIPLLANGTDLNHLKTYGTELTPEKFGAYPDYVEGSNGRNDIGYITLKSPAKITPLAISTEPQERLEVTLVGYGVTKFHGINGSYKTESRFVKHLGKKVITNVDRNYVVMDGEKNGVLPGDSGGPEIVMFDGVPTVIGINHVMQAKSVFSKPKTWEWDALLKVATSDPNQYGASIGARLTQENLCWVIESSGQKIPGVDCQ